MAVAAERIEEGLQAARTDGVLQLTDRLGLDLSNPRPRNLEDAPDLLQRVSEAVSQPIAELDDLPLPIRQGIQDLVDLLPRQGEIRRRFRRGQQLSSPLPAEHGSGRNL